MVREIAWRILRGGASVALREVDSAARARGLDARDRGLLRRLVGTETRRRGTLTAMLHAFAHGRPDADLAAHLRLGLVQLFFMDQIPDHAAVSETVGAVRETLGERPSRYTNAVLRAAIGARREGSSGDPRRDLELRPLHLAEPVFPDPREHPLLWMEQALSLPVPIARGWVRRYGEPTAFQLARAALEEPPLSLRVLASHEAVLAELTALGCAPRRGHHPSIVLVSADHAETALGSRAFARGEITVQGETALRAAELLEARPGERLLDVRGAGGKTAVLASAGARVLAIDVSAQRLGRVRGTFARLAQARAGVPERVELAVCDAAAAVATESFDGVLVDAPCSNTGVLAARPEARWRYLPAARRSLAELQERLLDAAARCVRPGGRLVYSTCSLEPEENGRRVESFLERTKDFRLELSADALPDPRAGPCAGTDTGCGPVDGGYAARLRRVREPAESTARPASPA